MVRVLFLRTPTTAEAGPGHRFVANGIYQMSERSFRYWQGLNAVELAPPLAAEPVAARPLQAGDLGLGAAKPLVVGEASPSFAPIGTLAGAPAVGLPKLDPSDLDPRNWESAPAAPAARRVVHAGAGRWNVLAADGSKLNDKPLSREEADALVAA